MKKIFVYAIVGVVGLAETMPQAFAAETNAPRSLEQIRADVRSEAMTSLAKGDLQQVRKRGWRGGGHGYRGGRGWGGGRHYGGRRFYGGRRYYGGPRYYGYRGYYGPRRYYRRHYRPGIYFGIY